MHVMRYEIVQGLMDENSSDAMQIILRGVRIAVRLKLHRGEDAAAMKDAEIRCKRRGYSDATCRFILVSLFLIAATSSSR